MSLLLLSLGLTLIRATVWAWPLDLIDVRERENVRSKRLPNRIRSISARGECVGIVTSINEIYIWNMGKLKDIDVSRHSWLVASENELRNVKISLTPENLGDTRLKQAVVVFHPVDQS